MEVPEKTSISMEEDIPTSSEASTGSPINGCWREEGEEAEVVVGKNRTNRE